MRMIARVFRPVAAPLRLFGRVFAYILARNFERRAQRAVVLGLPMTEVRARYALAEKFFRRAGYPG